MDTISSLSSISSKGNIWKASSIFSIEKKSLNELESISARKNYCKTGNLIFSYISLSYVAIIGKVCSLNLSTCSN